MSQSGRSEPIAHVMRNAVDFHRVLAHRGCGYFLGLIYVANPRLSRYSMGLR